MTFSSDAEQRRPGEIVVVSGTGTGIGKTVATAALASVALGRGLSVAVVKVAQTGVRVGEEGDVGTVEQLVGPGRITGVELARFADPVAPATAARRTGVDGPATARSASSVERLAAEHDLVVVEGAGGLLVRLNQAGQTIADLAMALGVPVLVVTEASLGTLSTTSLTLEALAARGVDCAGLLLGSWPREPDLAARCNVVDLGTLGGTGLGGTGLVGAIPAGAGELDAPTFAAVAGESLGPSLGGCWDRGRFVERWGS
ncbi:MAG: dethiobiotin synthase [Actinomycetota bacterium]|nr:dethiobiotin synthase [Actinomycetota bacterium]